jgi:hypothetical protein
MRRLRRRWRCERTKDRAGCLSTLHALKFDPLLESLIKRRVKLFCAAGVDAEQWEEAFDWLVVDLHIRDESTKNYSPLTSSHNDETEDEVVEFAKLISDEFGAEIEIIRV